MAPDCTFIVYGGDAVDSNSGEVLLYRRVGASYVFDVSLTAPGGPEMDALFGFSVAVVSDGGTGYLVAVGEPGDSNADGLVHLYTYTPGDMPFHYQTLDDSDADLSAFGVGVSLVADDASGYVLAVGEPGDERGNGMVQATFLPRASPATTATWMAPYTSLSMMAAGRLPQHSAYPTLRLRATLAQVEGWRSFQTMSAGTFWRWVS
jgi:hypothetical protein